MNSPLMSPGSRVLAVVNPTSGQGDPRETSADIQAAVEGKGHHCELRETKGEGDAAAWAGKAGEEGFDLVVVSGGDGTVAEAAGGLVRSASTLPLLVVPRGTANVVAKLAEIPEVVEEVVALLHRGRVRRFDVGYLPGLDRYFLLTLAVGFPAQMVEEAPRALKDRWGMGAYMWGAVRSLWNPDSARFDLNLDGNHEQVSGHAVIVTNMGGFKTLGVELAPEVSPHDGKLDVYVGEGESPSDYLGSLIEFIAGKNDGRNLTHRTVRRGSISADPPLRVQADGEMLGDTPVEIEVRERALYLVVPPAPS